MDQSCHFTASLARSLQLEGSYFCTGQHKQVKAKTCPQKRDSSAVFRSSFHAEMPFIFDKTTTTAAHRCLWLLRTDYFLISLQLKKILICCGIQYGPKTKWKFSLFLRLARWTREISDLKSKQFSCCPKLRYNIFEVKKLWNRSLIVGATQLCKAQYNRKLRSFNPR